jgi:hypothetical protein
MNHGRQPDCPPRAIGHGHSLGVRVDKPIAEDKVLPNLIDENDELFSLHGLISLGAPEIAIAAKVPLGAAVFYQGSAYAIK